MVDGLEDDAHPALAEAPRDLVAIERLHEDIVRPYSVAMSDQENLAVLQRFVDNYATDITTVQTAFADAATPRPARELLAAGLAYGIDVFDIVPEHFGALGVLDDAIVLRLAAKAATGVGATGDALGKLAAEAADVAKLLPDQTASLDKFVAGLVKRQVRGWTAAQIVDDATIRPLFLADVAREAAKFKPHPLDASGGAERPLVELRKMLVHALKRAGV
jgi:uncharacterized membrane protein YkvA (DUF1232 family)